jgi:hypothetical protein
MALVEPLENRGYTLDGETLLEKAAALLDREDFPKLAMLAETPEVYEGLGKLGKSKSPSRADALDRAVLFDD